MKRILSTILAVLMMTALIGGIETPALAADATVKKLAVGFTRTFILAADGRLIFTESIGGKFDEIGTGFTDVACGMYHALALKGTTLYAWGGNEFGQVGDGTNVNKEEPVEIGTGFTAIAADGYLSMALKGDALYTWGRNDFGQLGDGSTVAKSRPTLIGTGFTDIAAASEFALALKSGTLYAWGRNDLGQLGTGSTSANVTLPKLVGTGFSAIDAGWSFGMALKGDALFTWGSNKYGQLGKGNFVEDIAANYSPAQIGTGFNAISGGSTHALALKGSTLFAWGSNNSGAIGDGTSINRNVPLQIGTGYTAIAASPNHSAAAKGNEVYLWGGLPLGYTNKPVLKYTLSPSGSSVSVTSVSLSQTSLALEVGKFSLLTATVLPVNATNPTVSWSSSNSSVATVNAAGVVTGVSAGSATITVTTVDGGKTATCAVTVTGGGSTSVPVTGVTLSPNSMTLIIGKTGKLTATVQPANATNKNVTWSSSNDAVAMVNASGTVAALMAGKATITVTTVDGSRTASSEITVTGGPVNVPVTSVSVSPATLRLETRQTATLVATVSPADATNKAVTWKSNKTDIATVNANGVVTAVKVGSATITVTTNDGKKSAKCSVTVVNPVTSILVAQTTVFIKSGATATLRVLPVTSDGSTAKLTWGSNNKSIVTVDSTGKIKGVKAGTAQITASTNNGKSVIITVTVGGKAPTSVAIKNASSVKTLKVGNVATMTFTIKPTNAQGVLAFKSSNTSIVSVNNIGQLRGVKKGTATITVTLGSKKATLKITVN